MSRPAPAAHLRRPPTNARTDLGSCPTEAGQWVARSDANLVERIDALATHRHRRVHPFAEVEFEGEPVAFDEHAQFGGGGVDHVVAIVDIRQADHTPIRHGELVLVRRVPARERGVDRLRESNECV